MPIRLSGMTSGLDTDALVKELVSAYSLKKDKVVKAQKKQEWTMSAWKDTNTKVYDFYTKNLSAMRYSSAYNIKSATISNSSIASVSTSAGAVTGTQTLSISQLATSGYLTGGKLENVGGKKITTNTKLSDLGIENSVIKINDTQIELTGDTSVGALVSKMKSAGVNANFDENTQRFFISSTKSGLEGEFSITAGNDNGIDALKKLGLYATKDADGKETKEMAAYRKMASANADDVIASRYKAKAYTKESYTKYITDLKKTADAAVAAADKSLEKYQADDYDWSKDFKTEEEYNAKITELTDKKAAAEADAAKYGDILATDESLEAAMNEANDEIKSKITSQVNAEIATAQKIIGDADLSNYQSNDAVRITAQDAVIKLNGATFTSNTNSFSINGLNINATGLTTKEEVDSEGNTIVKDNPVTITTTTDTKGIYDKIKALISAYNETVSYLDDLYNAESAAGYEPLTDDEKEALTDKQIEEWEDKIKKSLLRKDTTLSGISSAMKNAFLSTTIEINGKSYGIASFGISSSGYFTSNKSDRNKFHIDGDEDDTLTSGNADKLMAAINSDPDAVVSFFTKLSQNMYDALSSKMSSSSLSSAFTIYNDKEMSSQYSDYNKKVSDWEDKLKDIEEKYYKKFAAMEAAMSKLQSQTQYISGLMGGN